MMHNINNYIQNDTMSLMFIIICYTLLYNGKQIFSTHESKIRKITIEHYNMPSTI